jgi:hypothetical protein
MNQFDRQPLGAQRPHSPYNDAPSELSAVNGSFLRCQHCSGQTFRRSSLRAADFGHLFLMRYPVRCLRCSQRQMVSFTVAGISTSSSSRPQKTIATTTHWSQLPTEIGPRAASQPSRTNSEVAASKAAAK